MKTLEYIKNKYNLNLDQRMPIEIPNVGRNEMIKWLSEDELNFENLIEVGVAGGEYSRLICENNIFANIYGIDPWKKYREYSDYRKETTFMKMEEDARNRMKDFPNYTFIKKTSLEALDDFKDESLDFVYIDANHRDPYITEDVKGWYKKVKKGGILAGHDYVRSKIVNIQVVSALGKFTLENDIKHWFILGSFKPKKGEIRDSSRSWVIIKE